MRLTRFLLLSMLVVTLNACTKNAIDTSRDYKTLGISANELLSSHQYKTLIVEINYMPGYRLSVDAVNNMNAFLSTYLNKPSGIQVIQNEIAASGKQQLSLKEVVDLEKKYRKEFILGDKIAVHILITDSYFSNENVLAKAYWNTSFCLFGKSIYERSRADLNNQNRLVTTLLQHEFGHLLGLVDQGSPMKDNHKDINNGAHCIQKTCLMHYEVETTTPATTVPPNANLDSFCIQDLKANGGK